MHIEIDKDSGFCFGVTTAIHKAEEQLANSGTLFCLGDIVHNGRECERLRRLGLQTVDHQDLTRQQGSKVMLRAHGEPPQTYLTAEENHIQLIDATCPVVLHLQKRIKAEYDADTRHERQIVIYGKNGHAEVVGLVGQTNGTAIVIESIDDARTRLDFTRPISLYSQTTMPLEGFHTIIRFIQQSILEKNKSSESSEYSENSEYSELEGAFSYHDTICRQVANRIPNIRAFAQRHDVVLFVCGKKSSNGKILYNECLQVNPRTYMVEEPSEIDFTWFSDAQSVGICGATSTPTWLMEQCRDAITNR